VTHHAERKVIPDDVRTRQKNERDRTEQQNAVDDQPETMPLPVALERATYQRMRLLEGQVLRMKRGDGRFAPQIPQQALLGDAFGDPPHDPVLETAEAGGRPSRLTTAATLLCLMEHHRKLVSDAPDDSTRTGNRRRRLDRRLTVQLVLVRADGNDEHVHRKVSGYPETFR